MIVCNIVGVEMPKTDKPVWLRFFEKIGIAGSDECWEWDGALQTAGYGFFGGSELAHRLVYRLIVGEIPEGMHVLHSCDNPPCCNPRHLWIGSNRDNRVDAMRKGRPQGRPRGKTREERAKNLKLRRFLR
jgi:hypothetical protein